MTATIAMTGATGFVGQAVLDHAAASGRSVRALTRRAQAARDGVAWVEGSLEDDAALDRLCDGADAVLHVAGAVNVPGRAAFASANIAGTQRVLDAATRASVPRFVHVSSLAAREPGLSDYGWSKSGAEDAVRASPLDWIIVRPPGVYGPRDGELLDLFRMARHGVVLLPPRGRSSWIHVDDLARLLLTLCGEGPGRAILEPSDGSPVEHATLGQAIGRAVERQRVTTLHVPATLLALAARGDRLLRGARAKLTPDRARYMAHPDWTSDPALAPDATLWKAGIGLDEGLTATAHWYRQAGWL